MTYKFHIINEHNGVMSKRLNELDTALNSTACFNKSKS
jgi:hypothetical protein